MAFEIAYSRLDRTLHRMAFGLPGLQRAAEDIESTAFAAAFRGVTPARPVLVTSLARAGTTVLLELLAGLPGLACTTYGDMPFVLAPILWSRLSGPFRGRGRAQERAHGDGVTVSPESPEGFEEVFWKSFWPDHYGPSRIRLWTEADRKAEAREVLLRHMAKIIALRRPGVPGARYLSKNNMNIARLPLLARMVPDAEILVPLRHPFAHARSLRRQHANFLALQARDPFVTRYMRDIGHFEFGQDHRPADFPGLDALLAGRGPESADYWLALWIAAFEEVARHRDGLTLIPYERFTAGGAEGFAALCARIGVEAGPEARALAAARLRPAPEGEAGTEFDPALRDRALALHADLPAG